LRRAAEMVKTATETMQFTMRLTEAPLYLSMLANEHEPDDMGAEHDDDCGDISDVEVCKECGSDKSDGRRCLVCGNR
jgi:hypothetical protein